MSYSYLWWAGGFRSPMRTLCALTDQYTVAVDCRNGLPIRFGGVSLPREEAMRPTHDVPLKAHAVAISAALTRENKRYTLTERDCAPDHTRIIEQGSLVQHFDIMGVRYADENGEAAPLHGHNDYVVLPDRLYTALEFLPAQEMSGYVFSAKIAFPEAISCSTEDKTALFRFAGGETLTLQTSENTEIRVSDDSSAEMSVRWHEIKPGNTYRLAFTLFYKTSPAVGVKAEGEEPYQARLSVRPSPAGFQTVALYDHTPYYDPENNRGMCERIRLHLSNPGDKPARSVICFAKDFGYAGIPGIVASLHTPDGAPTGDYVQLSKDWHAIGSCTMPNQGAWLHLYASPELAPHEERDLVLRLSFADYHGVFPASHAQLCLIGWGTNQLWDQCAIGCFGECITYDPDVNLNRSMVDDVRPILVYAHYKQPKIKWGWTENVGGNDFLTYFDEKNEKQYLTDVHTSYFCHGPLLTDVVYTGVSGDGAIEATIRVQTPASTDVHRSLHSFRYTVKKDVKPTRLAFYQMGADHYNNHRFDHTSIGDETGKLADYDGMKGGLVYHKRDIALTGKTPWISFHGEKKGAYYGGVAYGLDNAGAIANRGLIIRSYRAVLDGKEYTTPTGAIFGTADADYPSSNIELSLPPQVTELHAGDVITGEVEYFIPPQFADDYYGENENVIRLLTKHPDSWEIVHREAVVNDLDVRVRRGRLMRSYPVEIEIADGEAEWSVGNAAGLTPVSLYGVDGAEGYMLYEKTETGLIEADPDGTFHQVYRDETSGKMIFTYLPDLETPGDTPRTRSFVFRKK